MDALFEYDLESHVLEYYAEKEALKSSGSNKQMILAHADIVGHIMNGQKPLACAEVHVQRYQCSAAQGLVVCLEGMQFRVTVDLWTCMGRNFACLNSGTAVSRC